MAIDKRSHLVYYKTSYKNLTIVTWLRVPYLLKPKLESHCHFFVQLCFNLSNGVTDTLESSTKLIYLETHKSIYTQQSGKMPYLIKWLITRSLKMVANNLQLVSQREGSQGSFSRENV
jgi:hypothetical protein